MAGSDEIVEISYAVYFIVVALITGFSLGTIYELQRNDRSYASL